VKSLPYDDGRFDVVLDKATLDCYYGGNDSVDTVHKILKEYYRVLKPKGIAAIISYGLPEKRLMSFQHPDFNWQVRIEKVMKLRQINIEEEKDGDAGPEPEYHYIYVLVKVG
jgi:ubiquinone/menaquinone biosynthesis C-methylase UbiE